MNTYVFTVRSKVKVEAKVTEVGHQYCSWASSLIDHQTRQDCMIVNTSFLQAELYLGYSRLAAP